MRFYYEYLVGEWYWALLPCISQRDDDGASGIASEHGHHASIALDLHAEPAPIYPSPRHLFSPRWLIAFPKCFQASLGFTR